MKKLLSFILVLCLLAAVLPMSAVAEEAVPKIRCFNGANKSNFTITPSATPSYMVSKADKTFAKWTGAEAPTDNYVKFELIAGSPAVVKATFHNFNIDNIAAGGYTCHSIEFQAAAYNVEIVLEGENSMVHGSSSSIKCSNVGSTTISGSGSMHLEQTDQASAPLWVWDGDLLIKDTTLSLKVYPQGSVNSAHQAILSSSGNVTIENCKIKSDTMGGSLVWMGPKDSRNSRQNITDDTNRIITVKNCELEIKVNTGAAFAAAAPAKISNTTVTVTKTSASGRAIFVPAPTFEGDYTVIGGLAKNANDFSKLKVYQPSKIGSYTFISAVPGIQDLIPTEPTTAPTEPPVVTQPATEPTEETLPPVATNPATTPNETTPATTPSQAAPVETTPDATEPADTQENGGNPIVAVMITVLVMVVLAAAAVVVLIILKKKGILK